MPESVEPCLGIAVKSPSWHTDAAGAESAQPEPERAVRARLASALGERTVAVPALRPTGMFRNFLRH